MSLDFQLERRPVVERFGQGMNLLQIGLRTGGAAGVEFEITQLRASTYEVAKECEGEVTASAMRLPSTCRTRLEDAELWIVKASVTGRPG